MSLWENWEIELFGEVHGICSWETDLEVHSRLSDRNRWYFFWLRKDYSILRVILSWVIPHEWSLSCFFVDLIFWVGCRSNSQGHLRMVGLSRLWNLRRTGTRRSLLFGRYHGFKLTVDKIETLRIFGMIISSTECSVSTLKLYRHPAIYVSQRKKHYR